MKNFKEKFLYPAYYSLPVRLLILHLRKNQLLLLCWVLLFSVVTGSFGKNLGIPYLFLDPEYLGQVNFVSYFIVGVTVGGFAVAYSITCYILDGPEFGFLGTLSRPFAKFSLNNSLIPLFFFGVYIYHIIQFQLQNEYNSSWDICIKVGGFLLGSITMMAILYFYFWLTNIDIFKYLASNVDKKLKKVKISRVRVMLNLRDVRKARRRVDYYLDLNFRWQKTASTSYDKEIVLRIFNQNHLNSVLLEGIIILLVLLLGAFRENPLFQIPAAASGILLLTIMIMLAGAITYWLKGWATTTILIAFFILNSLVKYDLITSFYPAFGLDYQKPPVAYSLESLYDATSESNYQKDYNATLTILENWKKKFAANGKEEKPKMVFICSSGGGLRSALWTMTALQAADSLTHGQLMQQTQLITGASGGLIGAAYFRELMMRKHQYENEDMPAVLANIATENDTSIYDPVYLEKIAQDNLNPVIFTLLVNDLFVKFQKFGYGDFRYIKDRGYAFEQQLNRNTDGILDKPLLAYQKAEASSEVPMLLLSPTIVNDGRKLFISPQHVSYMNTDYSSIEDRRMDKVKGIDFMRLFEGHGAENLRFLTALRMNAAFPYVTPNVTLPTEPKIQIMDAGLVDNFGVTDAIRFMYVFREWLSENTSGIVLLSIRDSEKNEPVDKPAGASLLQRMTAPVRYLYENLFNSQDINNDDRIEYAKSFLDVEMDVLQLEYRSDPEEGLAFTGAGKQRPIERPSLSWRLTSKEKDSIIRNINHPSNQRALRRLKELLE